MSGTLSILLLLGAAVRVYDSIEWIMQLREPAPRYTDPGPLGGLGELAAFAFNLVQLLLLTVTGIAFLRWTYLAHKNLPELGARHGRFSPGWAVGSYFVPLIQLWVPVRAMAYLAKASRNPVRWDLEDTPRVIVVWWALWVLRLILDLITVRLQLVSPVDLQGATLAGLSGAILAVPLYLVAWLMIRRIWRDQAQHHAQRQAAAA